MNIRQAKEEIRHTVQAYLAKNDAGEYRIPAIRQRPILLMGPPGIGKTQIMEQVAREMGIGLVAYTITHHTRQSAVGLPFIREEDFDGEKRSVTEYTMSEIIASVYRKIRDGGQREGILFIDEINCVSETLAPTMLQFLQCKTFGNQAVPEGWLIVAAGNPPEYNRSVREFDMVTLDRVRCLDVEADFDVWKAYARGQHLNSGILSYLELRRRNFYSVRADVDGLQFVTARGWEDLSCLMDVYESLGVPVDETVIREYVHDADIAEDAAAYLELYRKYRDDYGIAGILAGHVRPETYARLSGAQFDERISVVQLLLDALGKAFQACAEAKYLTDAWYGFLRRYRAGVEAAPDPHALYREMVEARAAELAEAKRKNSYSPAEAKLQRQLTVQLRNARPESFGDAKRCFAAAKVGFDGQEERLKELEQSAAVALEHAFDFMEQAFEEGQEMVVFVTELTLNPEAAEFLAEHKSERYLRYHEKLLIGTQRGRLLAELAR